MCLFAQSLLINFLATLQGAWQFSFVKVGDKTTWKAVGVLDWVYSTGCFGVCVTACLGSALLPQFSSAKVEASSGNAPCELQWTCLDIGTRKGRRKPHCEGFGRLGNEEMKEVSAYGWDWDFFGVGWRQEMISVAVYDKIVVQDRSHSGVICTYMMKGMRWGRRRGMKLFGFLKK